jgi:hypothetical protein
LASANRNDDRTIQYSLNGARFAKHAKLHSPWEARA